MSWDNVPCGVSYYAQTCSTCGAAYYDGEPCDCELEDDWESA